MMWRSDICQLATWRAWEPEGAVEECDGLLALKGHRTADNEAIHAETALRQPRFGGVVVHVVHAHLVLACEAPLDVA
eukprot:383363-Pleurochrysis_carterae.AAC.2